MFAKKAAAFMAGLCIMAQAAGSQEVILAVNEGVTYQEGGSTSERYRPLVDLLSRELKRPVKVVNVDRYSEFDRGLSEGRYDMAFIHPAHIGLRAVKSGNYAGLATAKGFTEYRARIMVKSDSPHKSLNDLKGRKIGVPSIESITTVMFSANLREQRFEQPESFLVATRYQDAVPFMIENGFVEAGVTGSAAVEKAWLAKGGRVIGQTQAVPIKQFLASTRLSEAERTRLQKLILGLSDSDAGRAALSKINMNGFVPWNSEAMGLAMNRLGI
jgi:phosphonate transport system substrate-binding protein